MNQTTEKIWNKAKKVATENERISQLLSEVKSRIENYKSSIGDGENFVSALDTFRRMLKAHFKGSYNAFSGKTILLLIFGLVYFITPTDLLPDFIPALGFIDDISVIYYLFRRITEDISKFEKWEMEDAGIKQNNA